MKTAIFVILSIIACTNSSFAQRTGAEPDYYPMNYSGDAWMGEVTSVNEVTREITLTFKKKDKDEIFVGVLDKGYTVKMKDGSDHLILLPELIGMRIKVYYMIKTSKDKISKVKTNEIFKIRFLPKSK